MFSRSHSQQVAGWDSNPMSWLPSLCFIVIKVPTIFLTSLGGGAYMKNCPFSIIRMGVAHSWIWNPGWLCFCLLLKLWATSSAIEFFLILKKNIHWAGGWSCWEWNSSPHLSIPLWADTSPSVWCEAVVREGWRFLLCIQRTVATTVVLHRWLVSVQKRRPRPGVGPSTTWQMDVPWGRWAPWLWSWCWCAGGEDDLSLTPSSLLLRWYPREGLRKPPSLYLQSRNGNTHPKRLICIAKIQIYLKREPIFISRVANWFVS